MNSSPSTPTFHWMHEPEEQSFVVSISEGLGSSSSFVYGSENLKAVGVLELVVVT